MTDIFVITSIIKIRNDVPLYYRPNRNVFSHEQRFLQTLNSIESVRRHFPDNHRIFLIECSDIVDSDWEKTLISKVDYYQNVYADPETVAVVESLNKNLGEVKLLLKAFDYVSLVIAQEIEIRDIYKLSGRYFLESFYNPCLMMGPKCVAKIHGFWDKTITVSDPHHNLTSIFYKIPYPFLSLYVESLNAVLTDARNKNQCSEFFLRQFFKNNPEITVTLERHQMIGISGWSSDIGIGLTF